MTSGKYTALAGAISRQQAIANISNNLANVNTSGYKKSRVSFESILRGQQQTNDAGGMNYNRINKNFTNFAEGAFRQTDDPLDVAISGNGFFKIQGPQSPLYTRRGDFAVDQDGILRTSSGRAILDESNREITIPNTNRDKVAIGDDGSVYTMGENGARLLVGKIAVVAFEDESQLRRESDTAFSAHPQAVEQPAQNTRLIQGSQELSNVNMAEEMTRMIDSYRAFETCHKVIESYSKIAEKQEDLGTLG